MLVRILLFPLVIVKWALLVIVGGLLGVLISVGLELAGAGRLVDLVPALERLSEHVPNFLCGTLGGLIIGRLAFRTRKAVKSA